MTVTYTNQVSDCRGFGCFWKLLFRWRGSVYKLVYTDLLAYSILYYLLSAIYRYVLDAEGRRIFEKISLYMEYYTGLIPLSFVLGFYVSIVVKRWWEQFQVLPWPDSLSLYISTSIPGNDDRGRMMRRTIVRYANLSFTMTLIMISPRIKKRFPTLDHLIEAGLLTTNEKKIFDDVSTKTAHPTYWMPLVWAGTVVARARKEGRIRDDFAVKTIIDEINRLRGLCGSLLSYDWISVPLVYTQVVTLAVYSFFLATLMGRQFLDPTKNYENHKLDIVFPVFTYLQFFFYMGWLKVAESLVNPFGEDDDDFEVNWLVDRNVQVSYLIVDEMHNEHPELIQDIYWDEIFPTELPYTIASQEFRTEPPQGSTANLEIPTQAQEILPVLEEETQDEVLVNRSTSNLNMKRIGSNLSTMFHNPSNLMPKSSVLNFLHRSTSSVRKQSSYAKNTGKTSSKSSGLNVSPSPANRRKEQIDLASDGSLSGSELMLAPTQLPSSKESLDADPGVPEAVKNRGRRITFEDVGIQFNIKKDDSSGKEIKEDQPAEGAETKIEIHDDQRSKTPPQTPSESNEKSLLCKPQRSISVDIPSARRGAESNKQGSTEFLPGSAPSAPSRFFDYMKSSSTSSSRDQFTGGRRPLPFASSYQRVPADVEEEDVNELHVD